MPCWLIISKLIFGHKKTQNIRPTTGPLYSLNVCTNINLAENLTDLSIDYDK